MKPLFINKFLLITYILISCIGNASAQTNILEQIQVNKINVGCWIEKDNYYYFISVQHGGQGNSALHGRKATQYVMNKYNKNTLQRLDWKVVAGDTLQNDTLLKLGSTMFLQNDTLYLLYSKDWDVGAWDPESGYYIQKLDVHFNTALPEKRYDLNNRSWTGPFLGCSAPLPNGDMLIGHLTLDNNQIGEILILGHEGTVIHHQFPDFVHGPCGTGAPVPKNFAQLNNGTYIISGPGLCGIPCDSNNYPSNNDFSFQLLDSAMQLLDTFYYKPGAITSDTPMHYNNLVYPSMIALPGGSLICSGGTTLALNPVSMEPNFPLITKHTKASRYAIDKYVTFGPVNSTDSAHGTFRVPSDAVYNPYDNNLYFADVTHFGAYGIYSSAAKDAFVEVISLDTNLNVRWRKFIKLPESSHFLTINTVPDGRGGVIVGGYSNIGEAMNDFNLDFSRMWVYYVDDNTPSADPALAISPIAVHGNGFSFYPNPAKDLIHITSEKSSLKSIVIYDISGKALLTKSLNKQKETIDISTFSKGMYLLKCEDKDGEIFMGKVMKE